MIIATNADNYRKSDTADASRIFRDLFSHAELERTKKRIDEIENRIVRISDELADLKDMSEPWKNKFFEKALLENESNDLEQRALALQVLTRNQSEV